MQLRISNSTNSLVPSPPSSRMPHRLTILFLAVLFAGAAYYLYARSLNQRAQPQPEDTSTKSGKRKTDSTIATVKDCNQQAQNLYEQGIKKTNSDQAIQDLKGALACKPTNRELLEKIHYGLGIRYSSKKDYDQAIESYSQAISLDLATPIHALSLLRRGKLYDFQKQDLEKALEDYDAVISCVCQKSKTPDLQKEITARLLKSNALYRRGESPEMSHQTAVTLALQEIKLAFLSAGTQPIRDELKIEIHYQRAICHHALGNFGEAGVDYHEASEQTCADPYTKASILCDKALCYEINDQPTVALQYYEEASQIKFSDLDDPHESIYEISRTPLKTPPERTPASYKNSAELKAAIKAGKDRNEKYRTPAPSPSKKPGDTYFQTPHQQQQSP